MTTITQTELSLSPSASKAFSAAMDDLKPGASALAIVTWCDDRIARNSTPTDTRWALQSLRASLIVAALGHATVGGE